MKPKKIPNFCKRCGRPITIKYSSLKYNPESGYLIKERRVASCHNISYSDEVGGGNGGHYYKSWTVKGERL